MAAKKGEGGADKGRRAKRAPAAPPEPAPVRQRAKKGASARKATEPAKKAPAAKPARSTKAASALPLRKVPAELLKSAKSAKQIDWLQVETDYVHGIIVDGKRRYPTLRDIAAEYGCAVRTASLKCQAQKWKEKRAAAIAEARRKIHVLMPETIAAINAKNLEVLGLFVDLAKAKLADKRSRKVTHDSLSAADIEEVRKVLGVAMDAISAQRPLLGQPSTIHEQRTTLGGGVGVALGEGGAQFGRDAEGVTALAAALAALNKAGGDKGEG